MSVSISDRADWLHAPELQALLAALSAGGGEARIVGGAVRNTLLGQPVSDIDVATTTLPGETQRRAGEAGFRTVATGIEHGTVTVLLPAGPVEVTTLRADVATDGRHATVAFGRDWSVDASRRDFTINGLYATAAGEVIDLVGGMADMESKTLRFIGDPVTRIEEDRLRILRFFRFFAWYGAGRPDAEGLKACARLKAGLSHLSAERVWSELRKLLSAPDPSRALLWMRQTGVLTAILPESEKWGIDAIPGLVDAERAHGWTPDPVLRLEAIVPPDAPRLAAMAERLRLSSRDAARLADFASSRTPSADDGEAAIARALYRGRPGGIIDRMRLAIGGRGGDFPAAHARLAFAESWQEPAMPLDGNDLKRIGIQPGPGMGELLARLEEEWIESDFSLDRDYLLERARMGI